jgi:hypothetical protein
MREPEQHEIICPFPVPRAALGACKSVRSTLLTSSLETLRKNERLEEYTRVIAPEHKETILSTVAGIWLPIEVACAHYDALERLGFTPGEALANGYAVGEKVNGTFLGTMVKMASSTGVTPWFALGYIGKMYARLFDGGGGTTVRKLGPKDAYTEIAGLPLAAYPYFRHAARGMIQAACDLFCTKSYAHEADHRVSSLSIAVRVSWA